MKLVTDTGILLIFCITLGLGESLRQCVPTLMPCTPTSGCPTTHPVCDNGRCCLGTPTQGQVEKVCPRDPPGISYMCAAEFLPPECFNDKECPTGKKCCFLMCGPLKCHTAVDPPVSGELGPISFF